MSQPHFCWFSAKLAFDYREHFWWFRALSSAKIGRIVRKTVIVKTTPADKEQFPSHLPFRSRGR